MLKACFNQQVRPRHEHDGGLNRLAMLQPAYAIFAIPDPTRLQEWLGLR